VLVEANIVDVSALSRLLSSRRLVVIEDEDQTILKAIDKAAGSPLFSAKSSSHVLPAKGVGNFRAIADLGKVLKGLTGTKFDLTFIQDRDGLPDFLVGPFLKSQEEVGVLPTLLERHEIENYLLEVPLFERAAKLVGREVKAAEVNDAIRKAAENLKAKARLTCVATAKRINKFLDEDKAAEPELEEKVHKWFDELDLNSVAIIQQVFPGKEILKEALKILNEGATKNITRGGLVASIVREHIADDICELLKSVSGTKL
jgi:hypothetical protein